VIRVPLMLCAALTFLGAPFALAVIAAGISGAGATFPYPVYAKWAESYQKETGNVLIYQSIGSSGGIAQITARTVTFGASDIPLTTKELADGGDLVQWPMVMGGIVPVINVEGIASNELVLDGDVLAKIFLGEINTWDHAALRKLNPNVKLPATAIVVVHRSEASGTTFHFTDYLSKVSEVWKTSIGSMSTVKWPVGIGAKGNQGVAASVQQSMGSIGYVEAAYAKQGKLTTTKMINRAGKVVEVTAASVRAAAASWWSSSIDETKGSEFALSISDQPSPEAWPIAAATFILMPAAVKDFEAAKQALKFFSWAYVHGDEAARELGYVPIPASVKLFVMILWTGIKGPKGESVFAAK
jgi:phosphate transport system substrate-binding protein